MEKSLVKWVPERNLENVDFDQNFRKISISVPNFENLDFGQNTRKISISIKIFENLDFGPKFRFRSKI